MVTRCDTTEVPPPFRRQKMWVTLPMYSKRDAVVDRPVDERFRLLVESIEDYAIYMLDPSGHVATWNRGAEVSKGYAGSEILGRHFAMFFVPEDVTAGVPEKELETAAMTGRCIGTGWRVRKSGERFWASFVLTAIRDDAGRLAGFAKVTHDLSQNKREEDAMRALEASLRAERDRLHAAAESSLDAFYICEAVRGERGEIEDFVFTYLNSNVEKMVRLPRSDILGQRMCELFPINRREGLVDKYAQVVLTGVPVVLEFPVVADNVKSTWMRVQAVKLGDGIAITAADISDRKRDEERILYLAHHDPLTSLTNRSLLSDRLDAAIERARRTGEMVGVIAIDLDGFKQINDSFGHAAGDAVLVAVAGALKATVRASDSVIRMGGDEFIVIISDMERASDLRQVARKIVAKLRTLNASGVPPFVHCSVGLATFPACDTAECLLFEADAAMYRAKQKVSGRQTRGLPQLLGDGCCDTLLPAAMSALPALLESKAGCEEVGVSTAERLVAGGTPLPA